MAKNSISFDFTDEVKSKISAGIERASDAKFRVTTSKMTGKLTGIVGISTNPLVNTFCKSMQNVDGAICQHCYSCRMLLSSRKSAITAWTANTVALSDGDLPDECLPTIPDGSHVRFNPHGEITSEAMVRNFYRIARRNPTSKFVLFTKRYELVRRCADEKPSNVALVASTFHVDAPVEKIPDGFDTAFNVFTPDYVDSHDVKINCPLRCNDCKKCWSTDGGQMINERLK
jgi:hypothetical protein